MAYAVDSYYPNDAYRGVPSPSRVNWAPSRQDSPPRWHSRLLAVTKGRGRYGDTVDAWIVKECIFDVACALAMVVFGVTTMGITWIDVPFSPSATLRDLTRSRLTSRKHSDYAKVELCFIVLVVLMYGVILVAAVARALGFGQPVPVAGQVASTGAAFGGFFVCIFTFLAVEPWTGNYYSVGPFFAFFFVGILSMLHCALKLFVFPRLQVVTREV
eukprot:Hpha_TRINITY_DN212_c0_g1::TRINITY_DN212_c0_g1_i1::g.83592::m.83592